MPGARQASGARSSRSKQKRGLTVALTGPTGDIGRSLLRNLERCREVSEVRAMARRPFDPTAHGLTKTQYSQGDVLDRQLMDEFVRGADVVVHLAFLIVGGLSDTERVNLEGSRNVFQAAVEARVPRLVYASSVAAYGFHDDNPPLLTEDLAPQGTERHYYSAQKAALEEVLSQIVAGSRTDAYVFRPCIVAGADALALLQNIPYIRLSERMPGPLLRMLEILPALKPVLPDPERPSNSSTTMTWPAPCERESWVGVSRACTTWPVPASCECRIWPTPWGGTAFRFRNWLWTPPPSSWPACPSSRPRPSGLRASGFPCSWTRPGPGASSGGARSTTRSRPYGRWSTPPAQSN